MENRRTDDNHFIKIIETTPLVSIDLILKNSQGLVLLGKRCNRPAKDFWFVPGGRILKDEAIDSAMRRISLAETGVEVDTSHAHLLGAYDHLYPDNYFGIDGISTHYVALAWTATIPEQGAVQGDHQHHELRWWPVKELLNDAAVHPNTQRYFCTDT